MRSAAASSRPPLATGAARTTRSTGSAADSWPATTASTRPASPGSSPANAGDPGGEVGAAYLAKELLRETYLAGDALEARRQLVVFYDYCVSSDVPELEGLARTITRREVPILRWHRTRLTNATTEGTNLIIKNIKRLGFGFRNFDNYRLRLLLRCGTPWQHRQVASIRPRQPRISA
jgi:hypothetical protein